MTERREAIFAKIEELLTAAGIAGEVQRMPSGDPTAYPALHIFDDGQSPVEEEAGTTRYQLSVGIDGYVEGFEGAAAHAALNTLHGDVIRALFPEPVLGGLAEEITEGDMRVTVATRANKRRLAFSLDLHIHYATDRGDPGAA